MTNKKVASEIAVGIILLVALAIGGVFWMQNKKTENNSRQSVITKQEAQKPTEESGVLCTQDAKLCDDGSYVSRSGPKCEFASCPDTGNISSWENVQFDACGKSAKYDKFSWWQDFAKKSEQFKYYSDLYIASVLKEATQNKYNNPKGIQYTYEAYCKDENNMNSIICGDGKSRKLSMKDFAEYGEGCLSKDGSKFIAVFPGEYMGGGNYVFRYDIADSVLEEVQKSNETQANNGFGWVDPPRSFGKRMGNVIKMTGGTGDAGCSSDTEFDFDIVKNTVSIINRCTKCEAEKPECEKF